MTAHAHGTQAIADAAAMPYPGQAFDLVLAATVLHEMPAGVRAAALAGDP